MTTIPTLRALLKKVIQTESACSGDIDNEDWHTPAVHAFISASGSLEIAAINALPQLLAIAEAAQRLDDAMLDMGDYHRAPANLCEGLHAALPPTQPEARQ